MSDDENIEADPMTEGPKGDPEVPPMSVEEIAEMRAKLAEDDNEL